MKFKKKNEKRKGTNTFVRNETKQICKDFSNKYFPILFYFLSFSKLEQKTKSVRDKLDSLRY